jgi:D-glycero-alpha-D-manno-heptose 1-phosphate guanylyltransferase
MDAIVLCGGLGTRLGELTRETPKPLIEVAGRPFVTHVLDHLVNSGTKRIVLAVSFQWEKLRDALGLSWRGIPLTYCVDSNPMGTGGAIKFSMQQNDLEKAFVVNGDTLLLESLRPLMDLSDLFQADVVIALKRVENAGRFGRVHIEPNKRVISFEEKGRSEPGHINAGMYLVHSRVFNEVDKNIFSFENDILSKYCGNLQIFGYTTDAYFIDMGVPDDLQKARLELGSVISSHARNYLDNLP